MGLWRLNDSGMWGEIKRVYRLNDSGNWVALKNIWRLSSSGIWQSIFNTPSNPTVKPANAPLLYFRDGSGFETSSQDIVNATSSNLTSPAAFDGDRVYLTRGRWNNEPISFVMSIQKSQDINFSSGVSGVNSFSNNITRNYSSYSDSDGSDEIPLNSANRYTITKSDVRDGYYFRGYIQATNDIGLTGPYSTAAILPRMFASVSFTPNLDGSYGTNIQSNGGTFSWSYSGNETIQARDIDQQEFLVYPLNNTSGSALYSTTIFPGIGTSNPTATVTFTSANLNPATQYTIVIRSTMKDGWSSNSNVALRTIETDQVNFTTAAGKPLAPTNVTGTDVGTNRPFNNGSVSLSWTQGSNGTTITGYKIEYAEGPGYITYQTLVANTGNTNTSGTFTGLSSNTNYKFVVTAIGSQANSDPSADSNIVLITTVPNKPIGVSAVAGNASADVSFTGPTNNGGKTIIDYRATSNPGGITGTETISPIPVTGLTNYTPYTFTVAARNANGFSAESDPSASVTPVFPLPVGSGTVTIVSDSASNYIYRITEYGTWSNSATTYDYEWQTSSDGGNTWTTRNSGTNVATIPDYNASSYKTQNIRLRVYGRNQTGPSLFPLTSNTLFIFYTTPVITSFNVTGSRLLASWTYAYTADDPSVTVELEYKLSSASTWTAIVLPSSPGSISLSAGTYDFRLFVYNSVNGANRIASATASNIVVQSLYSFSFGNVIYPNTNGWLGLTSFNFGATIPSSGVFLAIFPADLDTASMVAWSGGGGTTGQDSNKYVLRFDGYRFGFFGQSAHRVEWMATLYTDQSYIDVKIITRGSSVPQPTVTPGIYNNGVLVSSAGAFALNTGTTFRINLNSPGGSTGIAYDEIRNAIPDDVMVSLGGVSSGNSDDGYWSVTTASSIYKTPTVSFGSASNTSSSISIPFTESGGTDYITYTIRTGSYSGTIIDSGTDFTSPLFSNFGINPNTTYYITAIPYNYKNQVGTTAQTTTTTPPPPPSGSGFAHADTTVTPSQPSTISFSSSNNQVTSTWTNGSPITSVTYTYSGAGTNGSLTDTTSPFVTSDTTAYSQSGTYTFTVTNFNNNLQVTASWNQSNAQSYLIEYVSSTLGTNFVSGNNSSSSVSVPISWPSGNGTFRFSGLTLYSGLNQTGTSTTYSTGLTAFSPTTKSSSRSNSTSLTYTLPNLITNPAYGAATRTNGGFTATISTNPNPTGGSYSVISTTAGSASVNSSSGALTVTGLSAGQSATVTVRYSLSGYNPVDITSTGQALSNLITNPAYGAATPTTGGWSATISTLPNPTGGTYSVVTQSAGTPTINSSTGALSVSGLGAGASSTVTVRYSLSGHNPVDITASGTSSPQQFTVTWNPNGGTVTPTSQTVNSGSTVIAPTPTRSGWTFVHWRFPASGGDPIFLSAGASYTVTGNITWTAIWTQIVPGPPRSVSLTRNQTTWNGTSWTWNCTWLAPNTGGTTDTYEAYREVGTGTVGNAALATIQNTSTPQTGLTTTSTTFSTTVQAAPRADAYVRACNSGGCSSYVSGNVG